MTAASKAVDKDILEHREWMARFVERGKRGDSQDIQLAIYEVLIDILEALKK